MAHIIGSRIKEMASSSGLADFTVIGAVTGFKAFASKLTANGDTTWYCAVNGDEWEEGLMTRTSASVYARTTILQSSNADAKVNFSAAPVVYCTVPGSVVNAQREVLTANRTYYVRTDGSDSNTGLLNTAAGAFLTLQKASDTVTKLDLNGFDVTVQVADGTYTAPVKMPVLTGKGDCTFLGNTATPTNVIVSVTSTDAFSADKPGSYHVNGFKLQTTTGGACLSASKGAVIRFSNINFGACAGAHIYANGGIVTAQTNYTISGGAQYHVGGQDLGNVDTNNRTVTLSGTPAFSVAFVYMRNCSVFSPFGCTFSGAATGSRYILANNATCFVNGAATTFLPGNAAGSLTNGATYG